MVTVHGGGIYISNNYGQSFDIVSGVPTAEWYSIAVSNSGQYYVAVATSAGIYYSSNYGVTFSMSTSAPTSLYWFSVAMSADGQYVAAGVGTNAYAIVNSSIYLSTNYGVAWSRASSVPTNKGWLGLAYNSAGTQLAATSDYMDLHAQYISHVQPFDLSHHDKTSKLFSNHAAYQLLTDNGAVIFISLVHPISLSHHDQTPYLFSNHATHQLFKRFNSSSGRCRSYSGYCCSHCCSALPVCTVHLSQLH